MTAMHALVSAIGAELEDGKTRNEMLVRALYEDAENGATARIREKAREQLIHLMAAILKSEPEPVKQGDQNIYLVLPDDKRLAAQALVDKAMAAVTTTTGSGLGA